MQRSLPAATRTKPDSKVIPVRASECYHLMTGDTVGAFVKYAHRFDESVAAMFSASPKTNRSVCDWMHDQILHMDVYCRSLTFIERPLIMPAPDVSLSCVGTLVEACLHAVAQTRFCPQEISLEISSSVIEGNRQEALLFMNAFRRNGFRVSIDARRCWKADLSPSSWLLVDTLRFDASLLDTCQALEEMISIAAEAGVAIVAENAKWRDAEYLHSIGVAYALKPKADA